VQYDKSGYEIQNVTVIFQIRDLLFKIAWLVEGLVSSFVLQQATIICGKKGCLWSRVIQTWKAVMFEFFSVYLAMFSVTQTITLMAV